MKNKFSYLFLLFLAILFIKCTRSFDPLNAHDTFAYHAYDKDGKEIVVGWLYITSQDSGEVTGSWSLKTVGNARNTGPQYGTGDLIGIFSDSTISVNLQPGWADNNVFLNGTYNREEIAGKWIWATFSGETAAGTFTAKQK